MMIGNQKYLSKVVRVIFFLLIGGMTFSYGQDKTGSPYSRFGLGDVLKEGTARSHAMGDTGIALRGISFLNAKNPASYTALDSISFVLDMGGFGEFNSLSSQDEEDTYYKANFSYLSFGFSVKKWWAMAAGVRKMSEVGYSLEFPFNNTTVGEYETRYSGNGGINKVYWSNAFALGKNFSVGVNVNYNWGNIENRRKVLFTGGGGLGYSSLEKLNVANLNYDFGVQFVTPLNKKYKLTLGAVFANKTDITGDYEFTSLVLSDTVKHIARDEQILNIPNSFGIGIALNKENKFIYTVDFSYHKWKEAATLFATGRGNSDLVQLQDSYKLGIGFEYTPDEISLSSYWDRVSYRFGGYYGRNYLKIKGNQLKEYGLTLGAGFPIRGRSRMDVALELGTKGAVENGLVRERFARLSVSFSLFEAWFRKMLYN